MGYIFGGDTGETQASIKRKRDLVAAIQKRMSGNTPTSKAARIRAGQFVVSIVE